MQIIPVIDIKHHRAVRAVKGERDGYREVNSKLSGSAEVGELLAAYLGYYRFACLYIADLDALSDMGENHALIGQLLEQHPTLRIWLDAGLHDYPQRLHAEFPHRLSIVLGTETRFTLAQYRRLCRHFDCILSLDYRNGRLLGRHSLSKLEPLFTANIIVMCMDAIGISDGPDMAKLALFRRTTKNIFMAGGVRHYQDLLRLQAGAAAGALLASCLHDKRLRPTEIAALEG